LRPENEGYNFPACQRRHVLPLFRLLFQINSAVSFLSGRRVNERNFRESTLFYIVLISSFILSVFDAIVALIVEPAVDLESI
jgi:hypothetical protein